MFRLLLETKATDVVCLTSVFGMGTGVSTLLWPSSKIWVIMGIKSFLLLIWLLLAMKKRIFLVIAAIALALLILITAGVELGLWKIIDLTVNSWITAVQSNFFILIAKAISFPFNTVSMILIVIVLTVVLWVKFSKKWAIFFAGALASQAIIFEVIKELVHKARPINRLIVGEGLSFPSGHSTTAVVFFGLLILFTISYVKKESTRLYIIIASIAFTILVGFSRIYLNVHWLSDVLGGFTLGLFLLMAYILIFKKVEKN